MQQARQQRLPLGQVGYHRVSSSVNITPGNYPSHNETPGRDSLSRWAKPRAFVVPALSAIYAPSDKPMRRRILVGLDHPKRHTDEVCVVCCADEAVRPCVNAICFEQVSNILIVLDWRAICAKHLREK